MTTYMIAEVTITDPELYSEYVEKVPEVIRRYGGRYLARGGKVYPLAGDWRPERVILLEFETLEKLRECFGSPDYRRLTPLRERSTISRSIIVEGGAPPE